MELAAEGAAEACVEREDAAPVGVYEGLDDVDALVVELDLGEGSRVDEDLNAGAGELLELPPERRSGRPPEPRRRSRGQWPRSRGCRPDGWSRTRNRGGWWWFRWWSAARASWTSKPSYAGHHGNAGHQTSDGFQVSRRWAPCYTSLVAVKQSGPDLPEKDRRTARINLRLDPQIAEEIRREASDRCLTLAELVEMAFRRFVSHPGGE